MCGTGLTKNMEAFTFYHLDKHGSPCFCKFKENWSQYSQKWGKVSTPELDSGNKLDSTQGLWWVAWGLSKFIRLVTFSWTENCLEVNHFVMVERCQSKIHFVENIMSNDIIRLECKVCFYFIWVGSTLIGKFSGPYVISRFYPHIYSIFL